MAAEYAGKVALVTGANSGLGKVTALELAKRGFTIVMACRNRERGAAAQTELREASGNPNIDLLIVDFAVQGSIREMVQEFCKKYQRLDLLINNAGTVFIERTLTPDGIEASFAVNHLASFLLTHLLLDVIKASAPARILNVGTRLDTALHFDDLMFEKRPYSGLRAYAQSKLGNIMFTYALAERLKGTGVTVNCVHPGVFRSNLGGTDGKGKEPFLLKLITQIGRPFLRTPEQAAQRVLYLALSPEVANVTGGYFGEMKPIPSPAQTHDPQARERLWAVSMELISG